MRLHAVPLFRCGYDSYFGVTAESERARRSRKPPPQPAPTVVASATPVARSRRKSRRGYTIKIDTYTSGTNQQFVGPGTVPAGRSALRSPPAAHSRPGTPYDFFSGGSQATGQGISQAFLLKPVVLCVNPNVDVSGDDRLWFGVRHRQRRQLLGRRDHAVDQHESSDRARTRCARRSPRITARIRSARPESQRAVKARIHGPQRQRRRHASVTTILNQFAVPSGVCAGAVGEHPVPSRYPNCRARIRATVRTVDRRAQDAVRRVLPLSGVSTAGTTSRASRRSKFTSGLLPAPTDSPARVRRRHRWCIDHGAGLRYSRSADDAQSDRSG